MKWLETSMYSPKMVNSLDLESRCPGLISSIPGECLQLQKISLNDSFKEQEMKLDLQLANLIKVVDNYEF